AQTTTGIRRLIYRVLSLGDRSVTPEAAKVDHWLIHKLAIIGIPAACILHGYVGFLFGAVKANPWWSTALMPIIFLASAIVSGVAALILLYQFLCWRRGSPADADCVRAMTRSLWISLSIAFSLELLELIHMGYERHAEWHVIVHLLTERLWVSYGLIQVLIGSVVPFFLLMLAIQPWMNRRFMGFLSGLSSILVLIQVFAMRWNVVVGGQMFSKSMRGFVEYPLHVWGREGLIVGGVVLLLPLVVLFVGLKLFPWQTAETPGDATHA
ncbi:MAG: polysulfide reductase NrfD, partial [Planctomycetaceae bacterium]|nr:polysulfide reductase NrfD [Planctomycetaceae bacterium]